MKNITITINNETSDDWFQEEITADQSDLFNGHWEKCLTNWVKNYFSGEGIGIEIQYESQSLTNGDFYTDDCDLTEELNDRFDAFNEFAKYLNENNISLEVK